MAGHTVPFLRRRNANQMIVLKVSLTINYFQMWICVKNDCGFLTRYHSTQRVNPLRLRQNGPHFADDLFKCIFLNENVWILIKFSLKYFLMGPINNAMELLQSCAKPSIWNSSIAAGSSLAVFLFGSTNGLLIRCACQDCFICLTLRVIKLLLIKRIWGRNFNIPSCRVN